MKVINLAVAGIFLLTSSMLVLASGSHSSDSGNMASSEYNKGKMIVHKKLICDSCPLKGTALDKSVAKDIVAKLNQGDDSLGSFQQSEVKSIEVYLQDRYSL